MCTGFDAACPTSVATAIGAAFQTQGYFVISDVVYHLAATNFGLWAPLLYIIAAMSGLIMMAIGQPPRMYLWFFMGPAIYSWALFTTTPVTGVAWNVANEAQDQEQVWKLAEVGLLNTRVAKESVHASDNGFTFGASGQITVSSKSAPQGQVYVPTLFLWFDEVISETTRNLSAWTGIYTLLPNSGGETNTHEPPSTGGGGSGVTGGEDRAWHILTNSKWPMLENITAAGLHNQNLREAFVRFMSNECGDTLFQFIDEGAFISAAHAKGKNVPRSVFKNGDYEAVLEKLRGMIIPAPLPLKNLLRGDASLSHSYPHFLQSTGLNVDSLIKGTYEYVDCEIYFYTLIQGFRWESGHVYQQLIREASESKLPPEQIIYNFLYGWKVSEINGDGSSNPDVSIRLDTPHQVELIKNMILLHIFRNEIAFAQNPLDERWSSSERTVDYTQAYQRSVGSKSKYGELYTWAKMMPYLQGVLLYLLCFAYPLVCVVMVIPGWWKTMFSWMAFFAWAKSWDVGFAIVQTLERPIWAMIGNTDDIAGINGRINEMYDLGQVSVECSSAGGDLGCPLPIVESVGAAGAGFDYALAYFDIGLLMAGNLDMDLANSYYIYLMSALYFAVPAVTGQVILGAKAGATSMINTAVGGVASEAGKGAGQGFTGDVATKAHNNFASAGQANFAKGLRQDGANLIGKAFGSANQGLNDGLQSSVAGAYGQNMSAGGAMAGVNQATKNAYLDQVGGAVKIGQSYAKSMSNGLKPKARTRPDGGTAAGSEGVQSTTSAAQEGVGEGGLTPRRKGKMREALASTPGAAGQMLRALPGATARGLLNAASSPWVETAGIASQKIANQVDQAKQQESFNRRGAAARTAGMVASANQQANNMMGQRYNQAAQQHAGEQQWAAMRNLSSAFTGKASALGIFAGAFVAGPKPMGMDGMAGLGQLNSYDSAGNKTRNLSGQFYYPNNQHRGDIKQAASWLDNQGGGAQSGIHTAHNSSFAEQANGAVSAGAQMVGSGQVTPRVANGNLRQTSGNDINAGLNTIKRN